LLDRGGGVHHIEELVGVEREVLGVLPEFPTPLTEWAGVVRGQ
jgi:hypothetical protein